MNTNKYKIAVMIQGKEFVPDNQPRWGYDYYSLFELLEEYNDKEFHTFTDEATGHLICINEKQVEHVIWFGKLIED